MTRRANNIIHAEAVLVETSHEEPIIINAENIDIDRLKKKIINLKKEVFKKELTIKNYKIQFKEKKTNHEKEIEKYKIKLKEEEEKKLKREKIVNEIIVDLKNEISNLKLYINHENIVNLKSEISDLKLYINELKINHEKEITDLNILINDIKNKWAEEVYNESI